MKVKTIILSFVAVIGLSALAMACSKPKVPEAVKRAFAQKFPTAQHVRWDEEEEGEFEAEFKMDGHEASASFQADGTWLETEMEVEVNDLPQAVKLAVSDQFANFEVEEAEQIETPNWARAYEVKLENEAQKVEVEAVFDAQGTLLKKKVEQGEDEEHEENQH